MVDQLLVRRLLAFLNSHLNELAGLKIKNFADFQNQPTLRRTTERLLQIMIEICIDIGQHIIADESWGVAGTNREVFEVLHQHQVISPKLLEVTRKMAGFRNILVHLYEKIDPEQVYTIYKKHLKNFDRFARAIENFLKLKK